MIIWSFPFLVLHPKVHLYYFDTHNRWLFILALTTFWTLQSMESVNSFRKLVDEHLWLFCICSVGLRYSLQPSKIKWASRWDTYLLMTDDQIHWFSIVNSLMIVLFLSGMVAMIMMRTLHRDISKYNQLDAEDLQEETGWKLVHGDVFRPPTYAGLLCVYVGTGVQFFGMAVVTMIFALFGFLSPANRGGLMTAMLLLWVFMGLFAGYSSSRLYKTFKGTDWKANTMRTALIFPGSMFVIFFILNALIWGQKSSGAIPFGTMFVLMFLWFGISVPLVFVGSYFGFKQPAPEDPVRTNKIPRQIPEQAWYMRPVFSILIGGILPFGAVFIELFFILTSIWLNQFYYIFGFLFLVFLILIVTCAEITIVLCYFQLCSEDYHWWWRAYLTSGSSAIYLFLYATFYFFTKLDITKVVSGVLYFGYMVIISYSFFVLTGTMGFYACYWFVRMIYGSVKVDWACFRDDSSTWIFFNRQHGKDGFTFGIWTSPSTCDCFSWCQSPFIVEERMSHTLEVVCWPSFERVTGSSWRPSIFLIWSQESATVLNITHVAATESLT